MTPPPPPSRPLPSPKPPTSFLSANPCIPSSPPDFQLPSPRPLLALSPSSSPSVLSPNPLFSLSLFSFSSLPLSCLLLHHPVSVRIPGSSLPPFPPFSPLSPSRFHLTLMDTSLTPHASSLPLPPLPPPLPALLYPSQSHVFSLARCHFPGRSSSRLTHA